MVSGEEYMELLAVARDGNMTAEEFNHAFSLQAKLETCYPTLAVLIICRFPHLMLRNMALRDWVRSAATLIYMDKQLRQQFEWIVQPERQYTNNTAIEILIANPQFHKVLIRAMLMMKGLLRCTHWERAIGFGDEKGVEFSLEGGPEALGHVILDHIKEGPVADLRILMGGNPEGTEFDGTNLIKALGPYTKAAAAVCATRAPELFLYRGRCFGLDEDHLNMLCLLIKENAGYMLRPSQKEELLRGDSIPAEARRSLKRRWEL